MRAAADLALHRLPVGPRVRGARKHRVLGSDPAAAFALEPARHALGQGSRAQYPGVAEFDQGGSFRLLGPAAGDANGAELVRGAAVGTDDGGSGCFGSHAISLSIYPRPAGAALAPQS